MTTHFRKFLKLISSPIKFRWFLATKLPSAYFAGLRIHYIDEEKCTIKVKFSWFNKNPFRSMYFAVEAMAAEMASGLLAFGYTYKRNPSISMLVIAMEIEFLKKATGVIQFTCNQGKEIEETIIQCVQTKEGNIIKTTSIGRNEKQEEVARFHITWSFKAKSTF